MPVQFRSDFEVFKIMPNNKIQHHNKKWLLVFTFIGFLSGQMALAIEQPVSLTVTAYDPLNGGGKLWSASTNDKRIVASLDSMINELPPAPSGPMHCPMDDGSYYMLNFGDSSDSHSECKLQRTGCSFLTFTDKTRSARWAATAANLYKEIESLKPSGSHTFKRQFTH
jgi:hypothetical protein